MMQKSVYTKIVLNGTASRSVTNNVRANRPSDGLVQILIVTEKQYQGIEYIVRESKTEVVDTLDRFVVL